MNFSKRIRNQVRRSSAEAANTPARTASSDAATTAAAATATTTTATATTTAAATATAAPSHLLEAGIAAIFLVEEMEGGEAHVSNFFFAEQHGLRRREVQFLRSIRSRQRRCGSTACERKGQPGSTQRWRHRFCGTLPLRSLLH
jgi:Spy/CpxP family protein refolding chaperone